MAEHRIRIGIVGTGFAKSVQLPAFRAIPRAALTAVASGRRENAERVAAEFGIGAVLGSWQDLVDRDDVDLVVISTPPHLHHAIALRAIENGKHVLCEKPMAMTALEAEDMATAAAQAGVLALIDHELRFVPERARLRALVREGFVGEPRFVRVHWASPFRADATRPWDWWSEAAKGGGILGALGSHLVDFTRFLLAGEVRTVGATLRTFVTERPDRDGVLRRVDSDDYAALELTVVPDAGPPVEATITMTVAANASDESWEVNGSKGSLRLGADGRLFGFARGEEPRLLAEADGASAPAGSPPQTVWARGFGVFSAAIVETLANGETHVPGAATFRDGAHVQRVLDAARVASAEGRRIELEPPGVHAARPRA